MSLHKDFLSLSDFSSTDLENLAEQAVSYASDWTARRMLKSVSGARIGLIAELPGWRNPTALALGIAGMGGTCVPVSAGLEGSEPLEDLAGYMSNWFDLLAVRTPSLQKLRRFAEALRCPVMNLRTNDNHPFEVLGDLAFTLSQGRSWDNLTVAVVGPTGNIVTSWAEAASALPFELLQVTPSGFELPVSDRPKRFTASSDLRLVEAADVIVTDCWPKGLVPEVREEFTRLRITAACLDRGRSDVLFVPCPPVTRGEEVSTDAMCHPRCVATEAKAYLMHVQNAFVANALRSALDKR